MFFYSDLVRALSGSIVCDFCSVSSYGRREKPSPSVQLVLDTCVDIAGQDVLLVEDIVDRGLTLHFLQSLFKTRQPRSLTTVALVAKPQKMLQSFGLCGI